MKLPKLVVTSWQPPMDIRRCLIIFNDPVLIDQWWSIITRAGLGSSHISFLPHGKVNKSQFIYKLGTVISLWLIMVRINILRQTSEFRTKPPHWPPTCIDLLELLKRVCHRQDRCGLENTPISPTWIYLSFCQMQPRAS